MYIGLDTVIYLYVGGGSCKKIMFFSSKSFKNNYGYINRRGDLFRILVPTKLYRAR